MVKIPSDTCTCSPTALEIVSYINETACIMNQYSESFVKIANDFFKECEKIRQLPCQTVASLDGVLSTLPHVNKTKGFVYEVLTSYFEHFYFINHCYVREEDSPNEKDYYWAEEYLDNIEDPPLDMLKIIGFQGKPEEPEDVKKEKAEKARSICQKYKFPSKIEKKIKSDFCPESAWEWLLLDDLWLVLARDEDHNFHLCKYVFDWRDCLSLAVQLREFFTESGDVIPDYEEKIRTKSLPKTYNHIPNCKYLTYGQRTGIPSKDSLRSAIEFLKNKPSLLPYAEIVDEKTIKIVYYAWGSWGGLFKFTYRASSRRWGRIKIEEIRKEQVFEYYYKTGYCPFKGGRDHDVSYIIRPYPY